MPRAQQLGRYHLLDRIAFGGMAEIYRAKTFDARGGAHIVAIKRVLGHLIEDDDFVQMLVDEAKICGTLRHRNIAQIYEFARAGDDYFMALEYVDGKDSRSILDRCRQLGRHCPPEHCAYVAAHVADALEAAHTQRDGLGRAMRIIHRDISPSNVLVSYRGEIKLCDFGIAKATLSRVQTKTGVIKGKVKYMSPEQAMGRKLDYRSDLFSLGVVLYELLTSSPPFTAPSEMELIFRVRDARYQPIHERAPNVPRALEAIVERALSRARSARFQSAGEMATALRRFLARQFPQYRRAHLSRFLRELFAEDIERELRLLEDYVVEEADAQKLGENLIADALGPDAVFRRFQPVPTDFVHLETQLPTRAYPRLAARVPAGSALHSAETVLLDRRTLGEEVRPRVRRPVKDPAFHQETTQILKRAATRPVESTDGTVEMPDESGQTPTPPSPRRPKPPA